MNNKTATWDIFSALKHIVFKVYDGSNNRIRLHYEDGFCNTYRISIEYGTYRKELCMIPKSVVQIAVINALSKFRRDFPAKCTMTTVMKPTMTGMLVSEIVIKNIQ